MGTGVLDALQVLFLVLTIIKKKKKNKNSQQYTVAYLEINSSLRAKTFEMRENQNKNKISLCALLTAQTFAVKEIYTKQLRFGGANVLSKHPAVNKYLKQHPGSTNI
ncbi:unnamed protein product [Meganyctiphanes norvegica]|uniref:Uncharacterized protein n=1 Tax=Meganyctiphanes norvegica TaxID=48144 RepID=A0AAV2RR09_MEGNR